MADPVEPKFYLDGHPINCAGFTVHCEPDSILMATITVPLERMPRELQGAALPPVTDDHLRLAAFAVAFANESNLVTAEDVMGVLAMGLQRPVAIDHDRLERVLALHPRLRPTPGTAWELVP